MKNITVKWEERKTVINWKPSEKKSISQILSLCRQKKPFNFYQDGKIILSIYRENLRPELRFIEELQTLAQRSFNRKCLLKALDIRYKKPIWWPFKK